MSEPNGNLVTPVANRSDGSLHGLELDDNDRLLVSDNLQQVGTRIYEVVGDTTLAAGTNNILGTPVPVGEIWIITHINMHYTGTITNVILVAIAILGGTEIQLIRQSPVVNNNGYRSECNIVLAEGDYIQARCTSATVNDDMILYYCGYKLSVK